MPDNVLETVQKLVQDVLAPDVRELKVRVGVLEKKVDDLDKKVDDLDKRFDLLDRRFDALDKRFESFQAQLLAAMGELKASVEASTLREVSNLRERVAVLEVQQRSRAA